PLGSAAARKVGRCEACPATYDEAAFEALRTWRLTVAHSLSVPAYVVFTDATLTAIAETRPDSLAALATVSGVGARKLEQYGSGVLAVLGGADPEQVAGQTTAAAGFVGSGNA
ncbi:MAG: HRDC domain-containing protein, partial [Dermatophilaceae bacterium]